MSCITAWPRRRPPCSAMKSASSVLRAATGLESAATYARVKAQDQNVLYAVRCYRNQSGTWRRGGGGAPTDSGKLGQLPMFCPCRAGRLLFFGPPGRCPGLACDSPSGRHPSSGTFDSLPPKGASTDQPRATPWVFEAKPMRVALGETMMPENVGAPVASCFGASSIAPGTRSYQGSRAVTTCTAPSRAVRTFIRSSPLDGTVPMIHVRLPCCWVR
jgi:hypothetical protein